MISNQDKAAFLIEALPFIRRYHGKTETQNRTEEPRAPADGRMRRCACHLPYALRREHEHIERSFHRAHQRGDVEQ